MTLCTCLGPLLNCACLWRTACAGESNMVAAEMAMVRSRDAHLTGQLPSQDREGRHSEASRKAYHWVCPLCGQPGRSVEGANKKPGLRLLRLQLGAHFRLKAAVELIQHSRAVVLSDVYTVSCPPPLPLSFLPPAPSSTFFLPLSSPPAPAPLSHSSPPHPPFLLFPLPPLLLLSFHLFPFFQPPLSPPPLPLLFTLPQEYTVSFASTMDSLEYRER